MPHEYFMTAQLGEGQREKRAEKIGVRRRGGQDEEEEEGREG